jgi:hypothetical protein
MMLRIDARADVEIRRSCGASFLVETVQASTSVS